MKTLVAILFFGIVFSLGQAMFQMTRPADKRVPNGVSNALTMRIVLSIILVVALLLSARLELL